MNMKNWFADLAKTDVKKAMPILSFPSVSVMDISVKELISDSSIQAKGIKTVADKCDTLASVSLMDLSVEAEAFGATIQTYDDEVPTVIGALIEDEEGANALKVPSVGDARTGIYVESIKKACELITDRPVFAGHIGPFSLSGRLMDMTEIMINCYTDPDMVHKCLEKATLFLIEYAKAFRTAGANGVVMAEPAAGLLSPDLIEEFSTPYVKRIIEAVQTDDFAYVYHNCGNTIPLFDSIKKVGASAYHFGNAIDISEMLAIAPSDMIVMGNIDPSSEFRNGTPESIYKATTDVLNKCKDYKNFVISSGCDIPPMAPWANIDSFFKAVSDFYS